MLGDLAYAQRTFPKYEEVLEQGGTFDLNLVLQTATIVADKRLADDKVTCIRHSRDHNTIRYEALYLKKKKFQKGEKDREGKIITLK